MASLRDFMGNPLWSRMYVRGMYEQKQTNSRYVDLDQKSATYVPVYLNANDRYIFNPSRYCVGTCAYDTGLVQPQNYHPTAQKELELCSDSTGDPVSCANAILGRQYIIPDTMDYRQIQNY